MSRAGGALGAAALWLAAALCLGGVVWTPALALALAVLWRERARGGAWAWTPGRVFWAVFALYLSTFRWKGGDDIPASLIPLALLEHGTLALDPVLDPWLAGKAVDFTVQVDGRSLSVYPIVAGVLAVPLYVLPVLAKAPISESFLHGLSKTGGAAITAGSAAVFFAAVSRRCSARWAGLLTLLYAAGTWSFSVSGQALWQHGPAQLGVALGLWGLSGAGRGADLAAGFGASLAGAARPDSVFLSGAILAALARARPAGLPRALAGAALPAVLVGAYWLGYTGELRPPESRFQAGFLRAFQPEAFSAMMLSPTRGLVFFCPAALLGAWAGLRRGAAPGARLLLAGTAATWVFLSHYGNWYGGMTFGTRYWAAACVVLIYLLADAEAELSKGRAAKLFAAAASVSLCVHSLGAYLNWPGRFDYAFEAAHLWDWRLHPWPALLDGQGALASWPAAGRWAAFAAAGCAGYAIAQAVRRYPAKAKT